MAKNKKPAPRLPAAVAAMLKQSQKLNSPWLFLAGYGLNEIPQEVFALKHLEGIDLRNNRLASVSEQISELPILRRLELNGNPIQSLPNCPGLRIDLPTYIRCRDQLDPKNFSLVMDLGTSENDARLWEKELPNLKDVHDLIVGDPDFDIEVPRPSPSPALRKILDSLGDLKELQKLSLMGLHLKNVPGGIARLHELKELYLGGLVLRELPIWIGQLKLERFSAIANDISDLPDSFRDLKQLKILDLSWNDFENFPACIFDLASLEHLRCHSCRIQEIPVDILRLSRLKYLITNSNPIQSPPAEIVAKGLDAVRNYWRQRSETGVDYLCEAKLIILGEAGAGKTSLARKIQNNNYELRRDEKATEGIDVIRHQFPTAIRTHENGVEKVLQRSFQVNIWDFGGQEIYHATHQFFLTRRSVYVLVCDDRKEDTDFSYWLQVVEMLSDASPLLIVQNEKQDRTRDINLSSLRAQFGNLREAIATNLETNRGLDEVIRAIRRELENLPHVGVGLPTTWKRVREALEKHHSDYISLEDYLDICRQHGFTRRKDKVQLSGYLHDLGICLHFQDDPILKNTVILKPSWGTDAVYRVLDNPEVIANRGQFTGQQLADIWSEEKYSGMQDELLQLMMRFQLCYALDTGDTYIAPQLLSSEQPSYPWDQTGGLVVRYEYEFLPKGIITRFIVAMHRSIADDKLVWKTGVLLQRDGSRAEIIEEYSRRRIRVRVNGPAPQVLVAIIDEHLERLHLSFPQLQYERYLPCPCSECKVRSEPYGFALAKLKKMAVKGHPIQCHSSGEMVDAERLVWDILPGALRRPEYSAVSFTVSTLVPPTPEVFVSYAWTPESHAIVDQVQNELQENGIRLLRDREEVRYKDSIRKFMRRIGQGKAVVVVISEKYLKSEHCMFEMLEIVKAQNLRDRIFPIVLPDSNIYKATGRIRYVSYWEKEIRELDEALKTVRADNLTKLHEDLDLYSEIRRLFDGIADTLRDMNALTPDQHKASGFDELIGRLRAQLAG